MVGLSRVIEITENRGTICSVLFLLISVVSDLCKKYIFNEKNGVEIERIISVEKLKHVKNIEFYTQLAMYADDCSLNPNKNIT